MEENNKIIKVELMNKGINFKIKSTPISFNWVIDLLIWSIIIALWKYIIFQ